MAGVHGELVAGRGEFQRAAKGFRGERADSRGDCALNSSGGSSTGIDIVLASSDREKLRLQEGEVAGGDRAYSSTSQRRRGRGSGPSGFQ